MATATHARNTAPAETTSESELLEQILSLPVNQRVKAVDDALGRRIEKVRELLPDFMKDQAERLVRRAVLTFTKSKDLQKCTPDSFVKCVLEAAEVGLAIDGRLCHAVPFKNQAQCILDYKGLIAVAKRVKLIQDAWARLVYENDEFELSEENGVTLYRHEPCLTADRGAVLGAFAVATHKDGWYRVEWMPLFDLLQIKRRSPAGSSGPWKSDEGEMYRKTVTRRLLKTFSDDPGLMRLFELDDEQYESTTETPEPSKPRTTAALAQSLQKKSDSQPEQDEPQDATEDDDGSLTATPDLPDEEPARSKAIVLAELEHCVSLEQGRKLVAEVSNKICSDEFDSWAKAELDRRWPPKKQKGQGELLK